MSFLDGMTTSIAMAPGTMDSGGGQDVANLNLDYHAFAGLVMTEGAIDQSATSQASAAATVSGVIAAGQTVQTDAINTFMIKMQKASKDVLTKDNALLGKYNATLSTYSQVGSGTISAMNSMVSATQSTSSQVQAGLNSYLQGYNSLTQVIAGFQF
jgi:hypothetical protein